MDSDVAEPLGPGDPREIGQFTVIGLLGAGGMGEVYLATREGRYVAVKRVRPRLVSGERFNREVAILHRVPFGVAPTLLASDSTAPEPWFATEYVPGLTVDDAVRSFGPLPADALWLLLADTAAHLRSVHEAGIVHRDLKPANIMLIRDGVKLIDFGIALAYDQSRLTRTGSSSGTRGFTAPEQEAGDREVSAPSDIYSLAATLVFAASVRPPSAMPDLRPIRSLDAGLAAVVEACLAAEPSARPTAADLVAAAREHAAAGPSWPADVMERIAKRRDFAATPVSVIETVLPPAPETLLPPELVVETDPAVETEPQSGPTLALADRDKRQTRRRLLVPLATVVALGAVTAGVATALSMSHGGGNHPSSAASGIGVLPIAGTGSSSAKAGGSTSNATPTGPLPTSAGSGANSNQPNGSASNGANGASGATGPGSGTAGHTGSTSSSRNGGGTSPSRSGGSNPPTSSASNPPPSSAPGDSGPSPTASSIAGIDSAKDPARVTNSEADTSWFGNDAACSAWLDTDGSGKLAGVLNTSLEQSCVAEVIRSDGLAYTFSASQGAEKTNFLTMPGAATMQVCVWHADEKSGQACSPQFTMNGSTPVQK
ncbi:protein kinase [Catenulispora sp. NF23]|uniref:serine/threonine-protein kinase n=1 Tax=Catenulispora pinistramenti TaxID=2705254 RepID=UPI001BA7C62F|nr:serine/threonine-protein kinase [Catenulispora pinistramenti]MBS2535409.1 protein kinase [Catenulispora pinistramenti]